MNTGNPFILGPKGQGHEAQKAVPMKVFALLWVLVSSSYKDRNQTSGVYAQLALRHFTKRLYYTTRDSKTASTRSKRAFYLAHSFGHISQRTPRHRYTG